MLGDVHVFCMLCCPRVNYIMWLCYILHICGMYMYRCMLYILLYMLCVYCVVFSNVRHTMFCIVCYGYYTFILCCVCPVLSICYGLYLWYAVHMLSYSVSYMLGYVYAVCCIVSGVY